MTAKKFTAFKLDESDPSAGPEFAAILKDLEGRSSILDMLRSYQEALVEDASPGNTCLRKSERARCDNCDACLVASDTVPIRCHKGEF